MEVLGGLQGLEIRLFDDFGVAQASELNSHGVLPRRTFGATVGAHRQISLG